MLIVAHKVKNNFPMQTEFKRNAPSSWMMRPLISKSLLLDPYYTMDNTLSLEVRSGVCS